MTLWAYTLDPFSFDENSGAGDLSNFWIADGQDTYRVMFCLETGVQTRGDPPIMVDKSETQIMVTYDLTDGFEIEVDVTPFQDNITTDEDTGVEGFFCDDNFIELTDEQKDALGVRGQELQVCVIPDEATRNKGYYQIDKILFFDWVRTDGEKEVKQVAIIDGQPANNGLTELQCDSDGCQFVSILKADFYQEDIPTNMPTPYPTEQPSASPTSSPTKYFPPGFIEEDREMEGHCTDNGGNQYDYYQTIVATSIADCSSWSSTVATRITSFPENVRGFEYDEINGVCHVLVDASIDRNINTNPITAFVKSGTTTSAISPVMGTTPAAGFRCLKYQSESYELQFYPDYPYGSATSQGMGSCVDTSGGPTDYVALYDVNQRNGINTNSCFNLCEEALGTTQTTSILGVTIRRDVTTDLQGNPTPPPYTGPGDFQCRCHLVLDGNTDSRITYAQNYVYGSGQGYLSADGTQTGSSVIAGDSGNTNEYCYLYSPAGHLFTGEGHCVDNDNNRYDYYEPTVTNTVAAFEGTMVINCPNVCDSLGSYFALNHFFIAIRGMEYDNTGACRCLVDGGFGDKVVPGFSFTPRAPANIHAVSQIMGNDGTANVNCYSYSHLYTSTRSYAGGVSSRGAGSCSDSTGEDIPYIALYDVNQRVGMDYYSCLTLCEGVLGGPNGFLGITIIRDTTADVSGNTPPPPYSGVGNFQCRCNLIMPSTSGWDNTAMTYTDYASGQGYYESTYTGAGFGATSISQAVNKGVTGAYCYINIPPTLSYVGEGYCSDSLSNQYSYYELDNPTSDIIFACPTHCQTFGSTFSSNSYPEAVRGVNYNGQQCRCVVDSGYPDRNIAGWTFYSNVQTATSAVSPIAGVSPYNGGSGGFTCYKPTQKLFNHAPHSSFTGSIQYMGSGACTHSGQQINSISFWDANQIGGSDAYDCAYLCHDVLSTDFLGFAMVSGSQWTPPDGAGAKPYTNDGNYYCECYTVLSGAADGAISDAQNYANYRSGQGYHSFDLGGTGTAITYSSYTASGKTCYRYTARRRDLESEFTENDLNDVGQEKLAATDLTRDVATTVSSSYQELQEKEEEEEEEEVVVEDNRQLLRHNSKEQDMQEERNLQNVDRTIWIGGRGECLMKFKRRVYRRNMLTGEDGWVTKTETVKRRLQVGDGGAAFDVTLGLQPDFPLYGTSAAVPPAGPLTTTFWWSSTLIVTTMSILLVGF